MKGVILRSFFSLGNNCHCVVGLHYEQKLFATSVFFLNNYDKIVFSESDWRLLSDSLPRILHFFNTGNVDNILMPNHAVLVNTVDVEIIIKSCISWHSVRLTKNNFLMLNRCKPFIEVILKQLNGSIVRINNIKLSLVKNMSGKMFSEYVERLYHFNNLTPELVPAVYSNEEIRKKIQNEKLETEDTTVLDILTCCEEIILNEIHVEYLLKLESFINHA